MTKPFIFLALNALFLSGCTTGSGTDTGVMAYSVDPSSARMVEFDEENLIALDSSDSALVYGVDNMALTPDFFVVRSRELIKMFSRRDRTYLGNLSHKGDGEDEYSMITRVWTEDDTVRLFDTNRSRVLNFTFDGQFCGFRNITPNGTSTHPLGYIYFLSLPQKEGYLAWNSFTDGTSKTNPTFSVYDGNFRFIRDIPGREMTTGSFSNDLGYLDSTHILYWESVRDTVFAVTDSSISPAFRLDYGDYAVPPEVQANPERTQRLRILYSYKQKGKALKASLAGCFQRDLSGRLFFTFVTTDGEWHLGRLDDESGSACVYNMDTGSGPYKMQGFMHVEADTAFLVFRNAAREFDNPYIYPINLSAL